MHALSSSTDRSLPRRLFSHALSIAFGVLLLPPSDVQGAVAVPELVHYQGILRTEGQAANGSFRLKFTIYDAATAGTALWTETQTVAVTDGTFSLMLGGVSPLGATVFDGAERWLGITVAEEPELTPRQRFGATPYAFQAARADGLPVGASIAGTAEDGVLVVSYQSPSGVKLQTQADLRPGIGLVGKTDSVVAGSMGVYGWAKATSGRTRGVVGDVSSTTDGAAGVVGMARGITGATYGVFGVTASGSDDARGVYGLADNPSGATAGVWGETTSTATYAQGVYGLAVSDSGVTRGVTGRTQSGSDGAVGVLGIASAASGQTTGVLGVTQSTTTNTTGVAGVALATSGETVGVLGRTESHSKNSMGVWGQSTASTGETVGVFGSIESDTTGAKAVMGQATSGAGETYGGYFLNASAAGVGVYGRASEPSGSGDGGWFESSGTAGRGVFGLASAASGTTYGLHGKTASSAATAAGVHGESTSGAGVSAQSGSGPGVRVRSNSGNIIEGYNAGQLAFKVDNKGNVFADGTFQSPAADFAEMLPGAPDLEPGDVLAVGPDGQVTKAGGEKAHAVIGVYSTQPAFLGGAGPSSASTGSRVPVAILGVVPVKASAENGPIQPNDSLSVSKSKAGRAAKAVPLFVLGSGEAVYAGGTLVGRALEGLEQGDGVIQVLVQLR